MTSSDHLHTYIQSLLSKRSAVFGELCNKISSIKAQQLTRLPWLAKYCTTEFLESVDPDVESRVESRFKRAMFDIEREAKGIKNAETNARSTVSDLLRAHLELPSTNETQLFERDRSAVQELLRQELINRSSRNQKASNTEVDGESLTESKSPRSKPRGRPITGKRGRPPLKKSSTDSWLKRTCVNIKWPDAEQGFFNLLRGFLIQDGGERRRMTTAQLCEYVREWQAVNGAKLLRTGNCRWINRTDDWSAVTLYALQFLTAESSAQFNSSTGLIRHKSRRLTCPRPFVDWKPRMHQWSWLLTPPSNTSALISAPGDEVQKLRFKDEETLLTDLFNEWVRAPRGLGGLVDAEVLASASETARKKHNAKASPSKRGKRQARDEEDGVEEDPGDESDVSDGHRLQIAGMNSDLSDEEEDGTVEWPGVSNNRPGATKRGRPPSKKKKTTEEQPMSAIMDDTIPSPLCMTTWQLRPFSEEEKKAFRLQEVERFARPWLPFVYRIQDYSSVVGPLRSAPSAMDQRNSSVLSYSSQSRARDHPLLRRDRPMHVSLAEIVRDAVACLPNGEGTRADITTLVQNSHYLLPSVDFRKLQQCVSSALDRLQGEASDPSVYFNPECRVWVYRHRHRTVDEFAEIHENRCAVNATKRSLLRGGSDLRLPNPSSCALSASDYGMMHRHNPNFPIPSVTHPRPTHVRHLHHHLGIEHRDVDSIYRMPGRHDERMEAEEGNEIEEEDFSDSHIPDIEELEAADMMRRHTTPYHPYYDDDDESDISLTGTRARHAYHQEFQNVGLESLDDALDGDNYFYYPEYPMSRSHNRSATPFDSRILRHS